MDTLAETTLAEFIRYNNWANQQVLATCQKLSDEQLAATTPGAYGTIRDTLEHVIRAEAGYTRLLTGDPPQPPFRWEDNPGLTEMTEYAVRVGDALVDAVNRIRPTDLVHQEWDGKPVRYQALALFIQIINHGIEHRTNITTILNQGLQSPDPSSPTQPVPSAVGDDFVDGWGYLAANLERFDFMRAN